MSKNLTCLLINLPPEYICIDCLVSQDEDIFVDSVASNIFQCIGKSFLLDNPASGGKDDKKNYLKQTSDTQSQVERWLHHLKNSFYSDPL